MPYGPAGIALAKRPGHTTACIPFPKIYGPLPLPPTKSWCELEVHSCMPGGGH